MQEIKQLLIDNIQFLINTLKPYKGQKVSQTVQLQLNDFIQVFSRIQFQQTKLGQLFKMIEQQSHQNQRIMKLKKQLLADKYEIMNDYSQIQQLLQTPSFNESKKQHDLSILCGEAYKNLMNNQSIELSKRSQIGGEWDSKLESDNENGEQQKIKQAFMVLDKAKLFEKDNLALLMKCAESTDKQIYMDFFVQVMNIQKKKQSSKSPELRDQVLQVPQCNEFSFESPLPSLRDHHQQPQMTKHVQLEDLLKIQERFITDESSPQKREFNKKPIQQLQQMPILKADESFYSQSNIKSILLSKFRKPNSKREKVYSDHIPRSSSSPYVERSQSTRQDASQFHRKISQPNAVTERPYYNF